MGRKITIKCEILRAWQHGQRRKKPTDFGIQLMAKQKLKGYYGIIGEKQFKNITKRLYAGRVIQAKTLLEFWIAA